MSVKMPTCPPISCQRVVVVVAVVAAAAQSYTPFLLTFASWDPKSSHRKGLKNNLSLPEIQGDQKQSFAGDQ